MVTKIYHLECEVDGCEMQGLINGFPEYSANGLNAPVTFSKPISCVLVGSNNEIHLLLNPPITVDSEGEEVSPPYKVTARVKEYGLEDVTGPEQGKIIIEQVFENTRIGNFTFNNEQIDFKHRLKSTPEIEKEDVQAYASKLKEILESQDSSLVLEEFKEKLFDYAFVYGDTPETMYAGFENYLKEIYFSKSPILDFTLDEIVCTPWCENRIWELSVGPKLVEFMLTKPDEEDMEYATRIFVAKVNGRIQVIR
jgi:hypothetical protein